MADTANFDLVKKRTFKEKYVAHKNSEKYYSGADTSIYFNTIWVPEITSIAFTGTPQDKPIFGYSDEQWSAVTKGNYIVEGQITVNFVETGYLHKVIRMVYADYLDNSGYNGLQKTVTETERYKRSVDFLSNQQSLAGIYDIEANKRYFQQAADASATLKKEIWKQTSSNNKDQLIYRVDQLTALRSHPTAKVIPPIDILIMYGNVNGEHQIKKIVDVRFISTSQTLANDGTPIQEVYTFVARDIDTPENVFGAKLDNAEQNLEKDITNQLIDLTDAVCDGLFDFVTRKDALRINFDFVRLKDDTEIATLPGIAGTGPGSRLNLAFEKKDIISVVLNSKFKADDATIKQAIQAANYDFTKIRPQCLAATINDYINRGIKDSANASPVRSYVATLLDQIAQVNPYMAVRNSRFIAPISGAEDKDIRNGSIFADVYDGKSFAYKMADATKYTNKLMCLENWHLLNEYDRVYFDTLSAVSGDDTKNKVIKNRNNRTSFESLPEDNRAVVTAIGEYLTFDTSWFDTNILPNDDLARIKGVLNREKLATHFYSKTAANLVPTFPSFIGNKTVYNPNIPMGAVRFPACLKTVKYYDENGSPLTSFLVPFDGEDAGDDYTIEANIREPDGTLTSNDGWFDFPTEEECPFVTKDFKVYVFVDGAPCKTEKVTVQKENSKFKVTFNAYKGFDAGYSKITLALIDPDKVDRTTTTILPNELEFTMTQKMYGYDKQQFKKISNLYKIEQLNPQNDSVSIMSTLRTKLLATMAMPASFLSRSKYTKRVLTKSVPIILGFCDQYQYMFDFQVFIDSFLYDLPQMCEILGKKNLVIKFDDDQNTLNGSRKNMLRERFRERFLNNYNTYLMPKGLEMRLAGPKQRQLLVTVMTDRLNDSTLKSLMVDKSAAENLGSFNYNVSMYQAQADKINIEPISMYISLGKIANRGVWSLNQYKIFTDYNGFTGDLIATGFPFMYIEDAGYNLATVQASQTINNKSEKDIKFALGFSTDLKASHPIHIKQDSSKGIGNIIQQPVVTSDDTYSEVSAAISAALQLNVTEHATALFICDMVLDAFRTKVANELMPTLIDIRADKFNPKPDEDKTGILIKLYRLWIQSMAELRLYSTSKGK